MKQVSAINWFIEERDEEEGISGAPLNPIGSRVILQRVGDRVERNFLSLDFEGAILFHLFEVICSTRPYFGRCKTCHRIFARRGRKLFCSPRCIEGARPGRRGYFRNYMKKRRTSLKRLKEKKPELADGVIFGDMKLRDALRKMGRTASR